MTFSVLIKLLSVARRQDQPGYIEKRCAVYREVNVYLTSFRLLAGDQHSASCRQAISDPDRVFYKR